MQKLPENLYCAAQIVEMERFVIDRQGIPGIELMRNAGLAVFELIRQRYFSSQLTVFCGAGNNAGDGYVVATLALTSGVNVQVFYLSDPDLLSGDALIAYQNFASLGGQALPFDSQLDLSGRIIVDALFGTGLDREVTGHYVKAIHLINNSACIVVAVDIPSGLHADTGNIMGTAVKADHTVTFIGLKQGLFTGFAADCCGEISFSSLEVSSEAYQQVCFSARHMQSCLLPERKRTAHKGKNGHVLVVGGDMGFAGAIRLAGEAALRVGAGLVSVATHVNHAASINFGRPELMCHGISEADELLVLLKKATVVVIGPGLGQRDWGKSLFQALLESEKPMVLDADALNLLVEQTKTNENWVLTPHPGECARLLSCSTQEIAEDRFAAVTALQKKYSGVAVLKGAGTLIRNVDETMISTTGNPGMASGGMGDVLAGMIGGLIAQNMSLYNAAQTAVYLHGLAADMNVQDNGEIGLLASDLMPFIRRLVNG